MSPKRPTKEDLALLLSADLSKVAALVTVALEALDVLDVAEPDRVILDHTKERLEEAYQLLKGKPRPRRTGPA